MRILPLICLLIVCGQLQLQYSRFIYSKVFLYRSYEFGLQQEGKNTKIEIKTTHFLIDVAKVVIDDRCYDSG